MGSRQLDYKSNVYLISILQHSKKYLIKEREKRKKFQIIFMALKTRNLQVYNKMYCY